MKILIFKSFKCIHVFTRIFAVKYINKNIRNILKCFLLTKNVFLIEKYFINAFKKMNMNENCYC